MNIFNRFLTPVLLGLLLLPAAASCQPSVERETGQGLDRMIGQMVMVGFRGPAIDESNVIARDIESGLVGGVVLFDRDLMLKSKVRNIESPEQVRKLSGDLQALAQIPLLIAVDQEGGRVQRFKEERGFAQTPSARELGRETIEKVLEAGTTVGRTLASVGCNLDFAPVADVDVNPDNPVIGKLGRSFSADPEQVAGDCLAFIDGLVEQGVLPCLKHFPGHGSSTGDSHLGVVDVTDTWSEKELLPYREILAQQSSPMVMTAHIFNARLDPDHPATLSKKTITGLLRNKLGFDGVVVTDDLQMKAIAEQYGLEQAVFLAIDAGADILLFGNNLSYDPQIAAKVGSLVREMVEDGRISRKRIEQSFNRIMALKKLMK